MQTRRDGAAKKYSACDRKRKAPIAKTFDEIRIFYSGGIALQTH
jgi:hypothetical protein